MKKLDAKFKQKGFEHELVERKGDMAIYKRWKAGQDAHYELVYITSHNGYEIAGNVIPPSEVYPNDNSWGMHGWTYKSLDDARANLDEKLKQILAEESTREKAKKERNNNREQYFEVTCPITKASRKAPLTYLKKKADKLKTDVNTIVKYYLSREGLKKLNHGEANHPDKKMLIKYNGKA